jgi:hypothetical protein
MLAIGLALAFGVTAAQAVQHTYFGPEATQQYGVPYQSPWNYPTANKAWRPLGYYESVYYTDGSTAWGFKRNANENPVVWPYSGGYAMSVCIYSDSFYQGSLPNVTCKYET